jgi:hypothetical protein
MAWEPGFHAMALGDRTMKADEIIPVQMPGGTYEQQNRRANPSHKQVAALPSTELDSESIKTPSQDRIRFNTLEKTNAEHQQIAKQIRRVNETVEAIGAHLSQMRSALEQIVKIYPPYPPESTERIEALRQFSGIRNMIDQLTTAQPSESIGAIIAHGDPGMDGPALHIHAGGQTLHFSRQPLHPGQGGLNIPEIPSNASDGQIENALDQTIAAQTILINRRQSFVAEANRALSEIS